MLKIFRFDHRSLPLAAAVAIFSLSAGYFALAWTEPSGPMPVTVDSPLNTGVSTQTKNGSLVLSGGNLQLNGGELRSWGDLLIHSDTDSSGDSAIRFIKGAAGSEMMRVDANGNVGIGTASPASKLTINAGGIEFTGGAAKITTADNVYFDIQAVNAGGVLRFATGGPASTNTRLYVDPSGRIGIGTAGPTDSLSLSSNSSNSINIRQGAYTYLGSDYSAWTTILGQNVRARRGATANMELGSGYKGSGASALRLNWDKIEFHAASAADIATSSEGSPFSFPKMTVQADGKIVINSGGQLCIGSTCANSSTWSTMVSGGGGGGGEQRIVIPVDLTPSDGASTLGTSPGHDFSFDPSTNKLSVVVYGNLAGGKEVAAKTISMSNLSFSSVSAQGSGVTTVNGVFCTTNQGDYYSTGRRYILSCPGYGVACLATEDNLNECSYYNGSNAANLIVYGYNRFSNISHYNPTKLRTDGTYLYAIAGGASYVWKIKLEAGKMVVVGQGSEGSTLPSGLMGKNFSYNGENYSASLSVPDRFYYYNPPVFSGSGSYSKGVIGYPDVILEKN